jgi:peptidoglycan/LPS O-acetylase OafA/YrhL
MTARSVVPPAALAMALGAADWELIRRLGSRREAWDDPLYWQLGYPLLLLVALVVGLLWPERPWRWVVWLMIGQVAWSLILALGHNGIPNLWPLGLMMFLLLAIPCLLAAYAGRRLGKKAFA